MTGEGRETRYALSDSGRRGIGVVMAAVRAERRSMPDSPPVRVGDGEEFLLTLLPLVRLPEEMHGTCVLRMALDLVEGAPAPRTATAWARLRAGRVVASAAEPLRRPPAATASGSVDEWLDALLDGESDRLGFSGRRELVGALVAAMHAEI